MSCRISEELQNCNYDEVEERRSYEGSSREKE
jgi:hypothetical protein